MQWRSVYESDLEHLCYAHSRVNYCTGTTVSLSGQLKAYMLFYLDGKCVGGAHPHAALQCCQAISNTIEPKCHTTCVPVLYCYSCESTVANALAAATVIQTPMASLHGEQ